MASLDKMLEHGLVVFNDQTQVFEQLVKFKPDARLFPGGQPLHATVAGEPYYYFADLHQATYPFIRVRADWKYLLDPTAYEAFTCLALGSGYDRESPALDRGPDGRLIWAWKKNTAVIGVGDQRELITGGKIKPDEAWINLHDVETGEPVHAHSVAVHWNHFRQRYVMILEQVEGTSFLGEIWYAEADAQRAPGCGRKNCDPRPLHVLQPGLPQLLRPGWWSYHLLRGDLLQRIFRHGCANASIRLQSDYVPSEPVRPALSDAKVTGLSR